MLNLKSHQQDKIKTNHSITCSDSQGLKKPVVLKNTKELLNNKNIKQLKEIIKN